MIVYVQYNSLVVHFFAVQRGMAICQVFLKRDPLRLIFSYFYFELNAFVAYSTGPSLNTDKHTE